MSCGLFLWEQDAAQSMAHRHDKIETYFLQMSLSSPFTRGIPFSDHPQQTSASSPARMGHILALHLIQASQLDHLGAMKDPSSMDRLPHNTHIKSGSTSKKKGEWMLGEETDIFNCSK